MNCSKSLTIIFVSVHCLITIPQHYLPVSQVFYKYALLQK